MNEKRPLIVTFIADISFLGAVLSILIMLFPELFARFGFHVSPLPIFSESIMMVLLPVVLLIAALGFLKLKAWGYWLLVAYNVSYLAVSIIWGIQNEHLFSITTFFELLFIIPTKRYFDKKLSVI